jgi:hypothetical protein
MNRKSQSSVKKGLKSSVMGGKSTIVEVSLLYFFYTADCFSL